MSSWIVDDGGQLWDAASPALRQHLGCDLVGGDINGYLVRNLGYIRIEFDGKACRLFVNPSTMTDAAFATLVYHVSEQTFTSVDLSLFHKGWEELHFASLQEAFDEIMRHVRMRTITRHERFMSERRVLDDLTGDHPLARLHQLWRALSGRFDSQSYRDALSSLVDARYMVVSADQETSNLYFSEVGRGIRFYDHFWHVRTVGLRLQDQPDYDLGQWVSDAYRDTIVSDVPRLDNVDIIASRPRQDPVRIRYTRVMLPLQGEGPNKQVLSASFLDDSVDLRVG